MEDKETGAPCACPMVSKETGEAFPPCLKTGAPVHRAAYMGNTELIENLVHSGADVNMIYKTVPPIYVAAKCNQADSVRMLIKLKCDINAKTIEVEQTALHCAASQGNDVICRILCDSGANLNQRDRDGATPLMLGASSGKLNTLQFLIGRRADVNIASLRGSTPLGVAVQNGHSQVVRYLLQHNAQVDMADSRGDSALHHAVKGGQVEICRMLINARACVNKMNKGQECPIGIAAMYGNSAIIDILINAGGDMNIISRKCTPIYAAVERQHINVLRRLIKAGADVDLVAPKTRLPLTEALHQHTPNYDIILELLRAGSDIDSAICECHDSPVNMVMSKCNLPIVILLVQADTRLGNIPESKMQELQRYCPFTYKLLQRHDSDRVHSLKSMCRKVIKRSVGTVHYGDKIQWLHIPPPLKKYLYHQDVFLPDPNKLTCPDAFDKPPVRKANANKSKSEVKPAQAQFNAIRATYKK